MEFDTGLQKFNTVCIGIFYSHVFSYINVPLYERYRNQVFRLMFCHIDKNILFSIILLFVHVDRYLPFGPSYRGAIVTHKGPPSGRPLNSDKPEQTKKCDSTWRNHDVGKGVMSRQIHSSHTQLYSSPLYKGFLEYKHYESLTTPALQTQPRS